MNPNLYIPALLISSLLIFASACDSKEATTLIENTIPRPTPISEDPADLSQEGFAIEGYVTEIYSCPPCPPDAICKPCADDNISISRSDEASSDEHLISSDLTIFAEDSAKFKVGQKYKFFIKIPDNHPKEELLNNAELIKYELIEENLSPVTIKGEYKQGKGCNGMVNDIEIKTSCDEYKKYAGKTLEITGTINESTCEPKTPQCFSGKKMTNIESIKVVD